MLWGPCHISTRPRRSPLSLLRSPRSRSVQGRCQPDTIFWCPPSFHVIPAILERCKKVAPPQVAYRQRADVQIAAVTRDLATLRRIFHLATEWEKVSRVLPRVRLLPGENHRERVLSFEDEAAYLNAAVDIGHGIREAYQEALTGIRAQQRGQEPRIPDPYLLRDVASVLIDCALRPESASDSSGRTSAAGSSIFTRAKERARGAEFPLARVFRESCRSGKAIRITTGSSPPQHAAATSKHRASRSSTRLRSGQPA